MLSSQSTCNMLISISCRIRFILLSYKMESLLKVIDYLINLTLALPRIYLAFISTEFHYS